MLAKILMHIFLKYYTTMFKVCNNKEEKFS